MALRAAHEIAEEMASARSEDAEIQSQREPDEARPHIVAYYKGHGAYMTGVADALAWTLGERERAPFSGRSGAVTETTIADEWRTAGRLVEAEAAAPPAGMHPDYMLGVWRALAWALFPEASDRQSPALYA